jgi:hypothetical protein
MLIPNSYVCTGCGAEFPLAVPDYAVYLFDSDGSPLAGTLDGSTLHQIPVRPAWCKTCRHVTVVEDIAPLRAFEDAYAAVRAGRNVEYPQATEWQEPAAARDTIGAYLKWRLGRRHAARALCCGGVRFQFLDVEQPLFKHLDCDFGVIEPKPLFVGAFVGPGPGVYSAANFSVHDGEGKLIGRLTWRERGSSIWQVEPAHYPPPEED